MSLFSRRVLQKLLLANRDILPPTARKRIANELNSTEISTLAAQWELTTISAMRQLGRVEYEPDLGGSSRLDLLVRTDTQPDHEFVVEITAVSDEHFHKLNPYEEFQSEFYRAIKRLHIQPRGFDIRLESRPIQEGKRIKRVLDIPARNELSAFFKADDFTAFLQAIANEPDSAHRWKPKDSSHDIQIGYDPSNGHVTGGMPAVEFTTDIENNSLYEALRKKYLQIRRSGYGGVYGIVVCDAGAPIFRSPRLSRFPSVSTVVHEFLRRRPKLDFIATIGAPQTYGGGFRETPRPSVSVFPNPQSIYAGLGHLASSLEERLRIGYPKLLHDGLNARDFLTRYPGYQWHSLEGRNQYHSGETTMKVRMSARSLLHLLGGETEFNKFMTRNGFVASEHNRAPMNPFATVCQRGDRLVDISLIPSDEDDDDYLEFVFEGQDTAVRPIKPDEPHD